jgi:hypothetical protein
MNNDNLVLVKMNPAKWAKLRAYLDRDLTRFIQIDAFNLEDGGLFAGGTEELMSGSKVRVLIRPDTPRKEVAPLLRKILEWIEQDENILSMDYWPHDHMAPTEDDDFPF